MNDDESILISDRFNKIIDYLKITSYRMAKDLDTSDTVIYNFKNGRKPSFDLLAKISNKYPIINERWLLTGRGEMLNKIDNTQGASNEFDVLMEPEEAYGRGARSENVSPTSPKSVSPTVSPTGKNEQNTQAIERHYQAICTEKERIIEQQRETIQALQGSLVIMRARIDDLEAQKQKNGVL